MVWQEEENKTPLDQNKEDTDSRLSAATNWQPSPWQAAIFVPRGAAQRRRAGKDPVRWKNGSLQATRWKPRLTWFWGGIQSETDARQSLCTFTATKSTNQKLLASRSAFIWLCSQTTPAAVILAVQEPSARSGDGCYDFFFLQIFNVIYKCSSHIFTLRSLQFLHKRSRSNLR